MTLSRRTWIILSVVFVCFVMPSAGYLAHRSSCLHPSESWLTIENQMGIDLTIVSEALNEKGEDVLRVTLGTVPAGETVKLALVEPSPDVIDPEHPKMPEVETCELRAQDPAGSVVWEMSWSEDEFDDLAKSGQTIVISPETDPGECSQ